MKLLDVEFANVANSSDDLHLVEFKLGKEAIVVSFDSAIARIEWIEAIAEQKKKMKPRTRQEREEEEKLLAKRKQSLNLSLPINVTHSFLVADQERAVIEAEDKISSAPQDSAVAMRRQRETALLALMESEADYIKEVNILIKVSLVVSFEIDIIDFLS